MAVAATLHWQNGFFLDWAGNQKGEAIVYHLLAIGVALVVVIRGGKWAFDSVIAKKAEQNEAPGTSCSPELLQPERRLHVRRARFGRQWAENPACSFSHRRYTRLESRYTLISAMPEQPQSEEQFRRNYECLRRLFDHAGDAIFIHGLDGRFTDVNRAACEMLGYTREELLAGKFPWDFVVRDAREAIQAHWAAMEPGVPITVTDELRGKDGITFPAEMRLVRYRADDREVIIALCRDITKRRQAEEARAQAEIAMLEERNRMAREIHDSIAQSFIGILLQLEAADAATEAGRPSHSYLCRVRELAKFGLVEARRSVLALRPVALEERGLEYALQQLAERSSIEGALSCEFSGLGSARRLDSDVELGLFRIAQEAVSNAIRHAKPTRISIDVAFEKDAVTLTVKDDGGGITMPASGDPKTGSGVSTMRERAQKMGGRIEFGTASGGGTRIVVTVPTSDRAPSPA